MKHHDHAAGFGGSLFMTARDSKMVAERVILLVQGDFADGFSGKDKGKISPEYYLYRRTCVMAKEIGQILLGQGRRLFHIVLTHLYCRSSGRLAVG
ncbi:MAG: hypothetical protein R8G34_21505 [Paracoccaceae bacterium]|nr:hypothetical protein [Paracoccaceae bacterium]